MSQQQFSLSIALIILFCSVSAQAKEEIEMQGMSVVGNKESPNLLYIVPWKSPKIPEMEELTMTSRMIDAAHQQVERDVLTRQGYYWHKKQIINNRIK
ncbi:MAG: hypothetical protein OQK32_00815 [Gammaproteobacteria bacterium]|nr:hypothetical protein [Gammaproteobacteria bacterium]MCW8923511.1 hypothetical protein [Gammaproteobacteria bacterium]